MRLVVAWVGSSGKAGQLTPTLIDSSNVPRRLTMGIGAVRRWEPNEGVVVIIRLAKERHAPHWGRFPHP